MNNELSGLQPQLDFESSESFFPTPALNGLKQQVSHLAQFGGSLIVVEGESGSGKSILANTLYSTFSASSSASSVSPVLLSVFDKENIDLFFSRFCTALGLPVVADFAGESIAVVRSYVQSLVREHKLCLVFIDDADLLDDETIAALLSVLDSDNLNHGIHLVLMARPGLARDIDRLSPVSLAAYDFSMPNFSPPELERFIEFALPAEYQMLFSDKEVWTAQSLWAKSGGFPGPALNLIAQSTPSFVSGDENAEDRIKVPSLADKAPIPFLHAGILVVLVASLIWVLLSNNSDPAGPESESSRKVSSIPVLANSSISKRESKNSDRVDQSKSVSDSGNLPLLEKPEKNTKNTDVSGALVQSNEEALRAEKPRGQVTEKPSLSMKVKSVVLDQDASTSSAADKKIKDPVINAKQTTKKLGSSVPTAAMQGLSKDESFLLSLPSSHYVLQILAASKPDSLQGYIQQQPNKSDLRLYQGSREGKAWYVVVIASFKSRTDAIAAIKSLPSAQSKSGPWAKPVSTVIAEIKENRRF